ncbi:MAG: SDR family oxidoreductase [Candidatus Pacebacteria bacterium]|nr:SDR family oxidoreductase [Candidatus Paceibacterota bacterium]
MNLKDKVIVITGGAGGLGKAVANILIEKEAHVVICDIAGASHQADVTKESDLQRVAEDVFSKFGRIDVWINNAGIWLPRENIENTSMEKANKLFQVNVFGTMYGIRSALKFMKPSGSGTIMNIISTTAFDGMNGSSGSIYVSSKYALRGLTNAVRDELKGSGVQIVGVYPGGIKTGLFDEQPPENIDEFMSVESVAEKIVGNLELEVPEVELVLKRPGQKDILIK